jgi:hypothetical protein
MHTMSRLRAPVRGLPTTGEVIVRHIDAPAQMGFPDSGEISPQSGGCSVYRVCFGESASLSNFTVMSLYFLCVEERHRSK